MGLELVEAEPPEMTASASRQAAQIVEALKGKPGVWFKIGVFTHSAAAQRARRMRKSEGAFAGSEWTTRLHRIDKSRSELFGKYLGPATTVSEPVTVEGVGPWVNGQY